MNFPVAARLLEAAISAIAAVDEAATQQQNGSLLQGPEGKYDPHIGVMKTQSL